MAPSVDAEVRSRGEGELRVAIIGAGVSGLVTCKHLKEQCLNAVVFEAKSGVGGVWRSSYSSTKLQTPKKGYEFTDFPWPESVPMFPSHRQVVDYLESYATHFGLLERIRFNCKVVGIERRATSGSAVCGLDGGKRLEEGGLGSLSFTAGVGGGWQGEDSSNADGDSVWRVCVRKSKSSFVNGLCTSIDEWLEFDYLVVCCGRFGDVSKVPSFPPSEGPEVFEGRVLHALEFSALDAQSAHNFLAGKRVVVVGFQKTSLDVACEVAEANQGINGPPCTLVFRRTHWVYPRHRQAFGFLPFAAFFSSRFAGYWTTKPGEGILQRALQCIFHPVSWGLWKMVEYYLRLTIPFSRFGLVPEHSLFQDVSSCVLPQLPVTLVGHLENGRIIPKRTPNFNFYPKGVHLADGTDIVADIVILCTGYDGDAKLKAMFPEKYRNVLWESENILSLYRGVIHPHIPNMGFIGFLEGFSSVHSSEMGAIWLGQLLKKKFSLPSTAIMDAERWKWVHFVQEKRPHFTRSCVGLIQIWHSDKLCQDMGVNHLRKKTWWQEVFSLYSNSDYEALCTSLDGCK